MALIKTTPAEAEFFIQSDPYNFVTDNRPLTHLLNNDLLMNAELEAVVEEVVQARTGIVSTYPTLDTRLDAMESSIGASVSIDDVEDLQAHQYGDFISNSEAIRRATPSGFIDHRGIADVLFGNKFDDHGGIRTTMGLGTGYENSIMLWAGWGSSHRPVRAVVNGWIVRLYNEAVNSPPTTPEFHITIDLGSASSGSGTKKTNFVFLEVWLEEVDKTAPVFYKHGAVDTIAGSPTTDNHLHADVIHTIKGMARGGNWLQLRHRIRVIDDVTPINNVLALHTGGFGFQPGVEAQGPNGSAVSGYEFTGAGIFNDDSGLWVSGLGDDTSKTDLGTYDGFVYAIPICMVHRRNSGDWSVANQNGSRVAGNATSGYIASGVSGRPDGLYYDAIDQRDILDMRFKVSLNGFDMKEVLDRAWQSLIRGELNTNWRELEYDYNNDDTWEGTNVWGHLLTVVDEIANTPSTNTNPIRDRAVSTQPLAEPDGSRVVWAKTPYMQSIRFTFTQGNAGSVSPSGFVTYNPGTETLTFNAAALSGAGTGGTKIGPNRPVVMRKSSLSSQPTLQVTGLGTQSTVAKMSGLTAAAEYTGYIQVVYPGGSGLEYAQRRILSHEVVDSGVTSYPSQQYGVTGTPGTLASPRCVVRQSTGHLIIADTLNHRVIRVDPATWAITHQFGTTGTAGATNSTLNTPVGVAVDGSDLVYVCDSQNHRVVKLSSTLSYSSQFGTTAVSGSTNLTTNDPQYCVVSGSNLLVTDKGNHRVISLVTSTMTYSTQFGSTGSPGGGKFGLYSPVGITTATSGFGNAVWITDTGNNRVVVLNTLLVFQYQIANRQAFAALNDKFIKDVAVDDDGNIYIVLDAVPGFREERWLKKYNSAFVLTHQVGGLPGNTTNPVKFSKPGGIALDQDPLRRYIYIADAGQNHRVLRLSMDDLSYLGQFGVTGGASVGNNFHCPFPADVAVDNNGNLFVTQDEIHRVSKVDTSLALVTRFGYGSSASLPAPGEGFTAATTGLRNPVGIAVNPAGTFVMVADTGNKRIMVFNGSLVYQSKFRPLYNTAVIARELLAPTDVECLNTGGNDVWYVTGIERPLGANTQNLRYSATWVFTDETIPDTPTNYTTRIQHIDISVGAFVTETKIFTGTEYRGIAIYDRTTPSTVEYTADPTLSIYFDFTRPTGISAFGDSVLVAEPDLHCVHRFSAIDGIFLGSAGVPFEEGTNDVRLYKPEFAYLHATDYLLVCDTGNHRLLRRHVASPWVSKGGTVSTLMPPVGSDKVRVFYEVEAYQGVCRPGSAFFKSDVRQESDKIFVSTLGLGESLTSGVNDLPQLRGMTTRLPLPDGWQDYQISPVGLKVGTADAIDDGPYLALPVTISEGLMGVNLAFSEDAVSAERAFRQTITRVAGGTPNPKRRGYKAFHPLTTTVPIGNQIKQLDGGSIQDAFIPTVPEAGRSLTEPQQTETKTVLTTIKSNTRVNLITERRGFPTIKSNNLTEAAPHFQYYPIIVMYNGRFPMMMVMAEANNGKSVSIGSVNNNSADLFFLPNRTLFR